MSINQRVHFESCLCLCMGVCGFLSVLLEKFANLDILFSLLLQAGADGRPLIKCSKRALSIICACLFDLDLFKYFLFLLL